MGSGGMSQAFQELYQLMVLSGRYFLGHIHKWYSELLLNKIISRLDNITRWCLGPVRYSCWSRLSRVRGSSWFWVTSWATFLRDDRWCQLFGASGVRRSLGVLPILCDVRGGCPCWCMTSRVLWRGLRGRWWVLLVHRSSDPKCEFWPVGTKWWLLAVTNVGSKIFRDKCQLGGNRECHLLQLGYAGFRGILIAWWGKWEKSDRVKWPRATNLG